MIDLLLDNLPLVLDADGDGKRIRDVILQLAVRGRLVRQRSRDTPFPKRSEQTASAGSRLEAVGFKVPKPIDDAGINRDPLPSGWWWSVMGDVGLIVGGGTPDSGDASLWADAGTAVPWVTPADLDDPGPRFVTGGRRDISAAGLEGSSARILPAGSVLFSSRAPIGKVAIAGQPLATNQGFKSCIPFVPEAAGFIYLWLLVARTEIAENATGTTFKEISGRDFARVQIPLPPLAEQHRIVAKVDELMALCGTLEASLTRAKAAREQFAASISDAIGEASLPIPTIGSRG